MCEAMEKFVFPCFDEITIITNEYSGFPKKKLLKLFQKYSEVESYLKHNLSIDKINYRLIIFLTIEGVKKYESMTKYIVDFNNKLLEEIECIIEEGKRLGEILSTVNSKSIAIYTLSSLQSALVLWGMNQNIDIKVLFETNFKYLWNSIKSPEAHSYVYKNNGTKRNVYDSQMISLNFKKNNSGFFMSIPFI